MSTTTTTTPAAQRSERADAVRGVVDLGITAATAYGRDDLTARLRSTRETLADRAVHVLVAGEFKQGKSSLVNALVGATVCPVDDDIATAVPTFLRHDDTAHAAVVHTDDVDPDLAPHELTGEDIAIADLHRFVTEQRHADADGVDREAKAVNVWLPRRILSGMVLIDTPGVGGLSSAHSTPTLGALPLADAVVFVTDASQELTRAEVDFLRTAHEACDRIVIALTKTDFYPGWRTIRDLNRGHLDAAGLDTRIVPVSAPLRNHAIRADDRQLNTESGYPGLIRILTDEIIDESASQAQGTAALDVVAVCNQLESQFRSEREALADPERAQAIVDELKETKARTEALRGQAGKWNQTLNDGIADLVADVEHDFRVRVRSMLKEADAAIENSDPADTWTEFEPWLYQRVAADVLVNYTYLRDAATSLSELVAQHFHDASGGVLDRLSVHNPMPLMSASTVAATVDTDRMGLGASGFTMLRGGYMGVLMMTMMGSMVGIAVGPVALGVGMILGRKTLREEKARQLATRRAQAKNTIRKYADDVAFHVNKDSRDTLRRVQRQLRDHYATRAEELHRSTSEALAAANAAAKKLESERVGRLKDIDAELGRIDALRDRAVALAPEVA
ncbi:MAG: dynamin family protein [Actinomycetota bacterium]